MASNRLTNPTLAKINKSAKTVAVMCTHNHDVEDYCTERFKLRAKCKTAAKNSTTSLRQLFDETTRYQTSANDISFESCESIMYRSRRETQPRIPKSALAPILVNFIKEQLLLARIVL